MRDDETQKLKAFIAERFLFDESGSLDDDRALFSTGHIDSFGVMELVLAVETISGVELDIPTLVDDKVDTFRDLATTIDRVRAPGSTGA